jgi:hypothetical protein
MEISNVEERTDLLDLGPIEAEVIIIFCLLVCLFCLLNKPEDFFLMPMIFRIL